MKKLFFTITLLITIFSLAACGLNENDEYADATYTSVDINPSIEVILDDEGIVVSIAHLNEDAEIVAANLDLVGLPFKEALELYINAAIETGYLDVDSNENIVTVTSSDEAVQESVKADVESILTEQGVGAAIFGGEMNEEYVALAEQYDISVGRARLISRAVEVDDELTFEAALELTHQEIMEILVTAHRAHMDAFVSERKAAAEEMKAEMHAAAMERVGTHRDAVDAGEVDAPDFDAIRVEVEANLAQVRARYQSRIEDAVDEARDRKNNNVPNS